MKKLYRFYVGLALVALVTIFFALALDHHVTATYAASIAATERAVTRNAVSPRLDQLAADVDAPANDVFESGSIVAESARMEEALNVFYRAMKNARQQLVTGLPPVDAQSMLRKLSE